jgi:acyl-CoA thioester hydrolase
MDAQGHVNNAAYVDYLQEARVDFLLSGSPVLRRMLDTGVVVASHQVEYLRPIRAFGSGLLDVDLWVDSVGASRFVVGYELFDGSSLTARARTTLVPFDLVTNALRRLTDEERRLLAAGAARAEPLAPVPRTRWRGNDHCYPLRVRWSDLDSYGHANNVKYYDYIQEARIAFMVASVKWPSVHNAGDVWMVVRQDVEYRNPMDFRHELYEVGTVVAHLGNRSVTLAAEIRDPVTQAVFASAGTIVVGQAPLTPEQRVALGTWLR